MSNRNSNKVIIVTYHYVRELQYTKYPKIKGLLFSKFKKQIEELKKYCSIISIDDLYNHIYHKVPLPNRAVLLTFDDCYAEHYTNVFPYLHDLKVQGSFFAPVKAIEKNTFLDVNKIHFILASTDNYQDIIQNIFSLMDDFREEYKLESNKYYFDKLSKANALDPAEIMLIKRLLQKELPKEFRKKILNSLFTKYVTKDEKSFSQDLYTSFDQLMLMKNANMHIGGHGYNHHWLNKLTPLQQEKEIELTTNFLIKLYEKKEYWTICYPYGGYNDSLIYILKNNNYKLGFTVRSNVANLRKENALTLERIDTTLVPDLSKQKAIEWFKAPSLWH